MVSLKADVQKRTFVRNFTLKERSSTRRQTKQKHLALCRVGVKECDLTVRELNLCFGCFCPVIFF